MAVAVARVLSENHSSGSAFRHAALSPHSGAPPSASARSAAACCHDPPVAGTTVSAGSAGSPGRLPADALNLSP